MTGLNASASRKFSRLSLSMDFVRASGHHSHVKARGQCFNPMFQHVPSQTRSSSGTSEFCFTLPAMRSAGTGASQASRSSSTSNAFWNPYNHPSETSSRSSCDGEESNHPGSKEEGRARDDEIEVLPPPGGFLCPDDGYFERRSDDSDSEAEDQEQPAQREPQVNLYPAELNEPGRVQPVVVGPCKAGYAGGAPAVEEKAPAIPCTPGRVFDMSREKKARVWQKPLPPGAVKPEP